MDKHANQPSAAAHSTRMSSHGYAAAIESHRKRAAALDVDDALGSRRNDFYLPDGVVYLDGNSLGLLSTYAERTTLALLDSWKQYGIGGWSQGEQPWFHLSEQMGDALADLVGATPGSVITSGSTTVNLHQLMATFYRPTQARHKILADELNFPSDIYALQSHVGLHGYNPGEALLRVASRDGKTLSEDDIIAAMTDDVAIAVLPSVLYRSGQLLDMERITRVGHERGLLVGWDLCHSIGSVPHQLDTWDVDFAFWCNYKYLNAGPGSVAGLYVNPRHAPVQPGLAGWFGGDKDTQFDMSHTFTPAQGAGRFQMGTPHVLSLAPLIGSLEMFREVGIAAIREKSLALTRFLMDLADDMLSPYGFTIGNPREDHRRGGHVCLVHEQAIRICKAMKDAGVIPDFRAPDVIRLAPIALYTSFADVVEAVSRIRGIMEAKAYEQYANERDVIA